MSNLRRREVLYIGAAQVVGPAFLIGQRARPTTTTDESPENSVAVRLADERSTTDASPRELLAPEDLVSRWGRTPGQQVRLRRNADEVAAFTIETVPGGVSNGTVRLAEDGMSRLGTQDGFDATVSSPVPHSLTPTAAAREGEYVETLHDPGDRGLVVAAPHGGRIEPYTDAQAERIAERLPSSTVWIGRGWRPDGGSYDRWHIPSTDIHPDSYPALGRIRDRGFENAVAFHGFGGTGIRIGGRAPDLLKREVRTAVEDAVGDVLDVRPATDDEYLGSDPDNLVNWLTANGRNGVQLEQSFEARRDHWQSIADAVAGVVD